MEDGQLLGVEPVAELQLVCSLCYSMPQDRMTNNCVSIFKRKSIIRIASVDLKISKLKKKKKINVS